MAVLGRHGGGEQRQRACLKEKMSSSTPALSAAFQAQYQICDMCCPKILKYLDTKQVVVVATQLVWGVCSVFVLFLIEPTQEFAALLVFIDFVFFNLRMGYWQPRIRRVKGTLPEQLHSTARVKKVIPGTVGERRSHLPSPRELK